MIGQRIRVRGTVQGVGFRPAVWRIARELGLRGHVANDGDGVLIEVWGASADVERFVGRVRREAPPLARIGEIERAPADADADVAPFHIAASDASSTVVNPQLAADAALCADCRAEILDPASRRYRYAFTNCTQCGPRLSIVRGVPYDRERTTMASFAMCEDCAREYNDPADRRFHAQPIACPKCGPRLALRAPDSSGIDAPDVLLTAASLIEQGRIVVIQGVGGYQLACDATNAKAVSRLRARKQRHRKPFALMARDVDAIRRFCRVSEIEATALQSAAAPIVLLDRADDHGIAPGVAPGVGGFGFMLPATPLHLLLVQALARPIVLTSGNLSDEPQAIDAGDAHERLGAIADAFVEHDRPIARRIDDSVVRICAGSARVMRRARGYAPQAIEMPAGFEHCPPVLALGGELKNTFCLLRNAAATLSPHVGDLDDARTRREYEDAVADFCSFHAFTPRVVACDLHPDYASTQFAQQQACTVERVQHHHAHIAACLAENHVPLDADPVLGVALDGAGFGTDGTSWGGEVLLADYRGFERIASLQPFPLLGGDAAAREPWRNTYAHIVATIGWDAFERGFSRTDLHQFLASKPRATLDRMLERGVNAPLSSSCGRWFDAVAAAIGIARDRAHYEGQAAIELEAIADRAHDDAYPFAITADQRIEPTPMWQALLRDLAGNVRAGVIAARFHNGLAAALAELLERLRNRSTAVALSGGVFQNRLLLERLGTLLEVRGFQVLTHRRVPCNDGGLALGQAAVAAARLLRS